MSDLDVAIVGMSVRLAGAADTRTFWNNLVEARCSLEPLSDAELAEAGVDPDELRQPSYVRVGGKLPDLECFDNEFFGISNREARLFDPQHRLLLELGWKAFEDAGYDISRFAGRVGVYGGVESLSTYLTHVLLRSPEVDLARDGQAIILGNTPDHAITRLSYLFDLRGPSIAHQTGCSTSLVAIHEACQGLLSFQTDMALAGGCSVTLPNPRGYLYHRDSFFSPDGCIRAFDARAAGTVFTGGAALVVLKRRADAERDGDFIHAVIKGSAVNNDGSDKVGYVAPSIRGQSQVIRDALAISEVAAETIEYVETHGTGTELGDQVEIRALTEAYRASTQATQFCAIGSVKTNVGHTEVAAGVVGLIKAALALEHRVIPASLGIEAPNPGLKLETSPFFVSTRTRAWETRQRRRRAAVSSFGIGGTNAHAILEEAGERAAHPRRRAAYCLTLSARTAESLTALRAAYAAWFAAGVTHDLADICYTSNVGRRAFKHRLAVTGGDLAALRDGLERAAVAAASTGTLVVELDAEAARRLLPDPPAGLGSGDPVERATSHLVGLLCSSGIDARGAGPGAGAACRLIVTRNAAWLDDGHGARVQVGGPSDLDQLVAAVAGQAWVFGVAVDWDRFHAGEQRLRVPLPTYAFARRRHWVDTRGGNRAAPASGEKNLDIGQWFYRPVWHETAPAVGLDSAVAGAVVVLVTRSAPGPAVLEALAGARVVQVTLGGGFERVASDRYRIAPDDEQSCAELVAALADAGSLPRFLLHALLVDDTSWTGDDSGFARTQMLGLNNLVLLLRQLVRRLPDEQRLSVAVAASDVSDALGGERTNPDKATVLGATRTFPSEYPNIDCRVVDISLAELERDVATARLLVAELAAPVAPENEIVALRGGRRWHQTFARVQVAAPVAAPVKPGGVYVVLGGLGELGLSLSRYLAERACCHLVLIGSSRFIARPEWTAWLAAHDQDNSYSKKIARLQAVEALGTRVTVVQCDVADRTRLSAALDAVAAAHGSIDAIIHAAGIVESGMIAHKDVARFADVFRAKVRGTYHLLQYAASHPGPKLILCSSMNSLVGGLGQIDNTASNAFVDAITATGLARRGGDVCSINWGAISSARLAEPVVLPQFADLSREHKKNHMSEAEIGQVYDRILSRTFGPRLVVSTIDFDVVLKRWGEVARVTELARLRRVAAAIGEARAPGGASRDYRSPTHRFVVEAWAGILGVDDLAWDDDLFARGAHSLAAVQFAAMLKESLGLRFHAMGVYEFPRVGAMVEYVQRLQDDRDAKAALAGARMELAT